MKELQKSLIASVGEMVSAFGFRKNLSEQAFLKPMAGGRFAFHLAFINHRHDFDISADAAIRFDELEDLINADNKLLSKKEKTMTYSLGAEIGNLMGGTQKRWTIVSDEDVARVASDLFAVFRDYAIPYFETYSHPEKALEILSGHAPENWKHSPIHVSRAKRALGLAMLLGRKDLAPRLVKESIEFLQKFKDGSVEDYSNFAQRVITPS